MKICMVNPADFARCEVFELAGRLQNKGHEVTVVYPTDGKSLSSAVRTIPFPARFLPKIHYTVPAFHSEYCLLSSLVRGEKYEILQACDYDYLTSLPPVLVKRRVKTPLVVTTDAFPGVSWSFGNFFVDACARVYTPTLGRFILDSCDHLVVLSSNLLDDARRLGMPQEKISSIPLGVDPKRFKPQVESSHLKEELGIEKDEKVLLFVGRLSLVKRVDLLIELTKRLSGEGFRLKTVIVGEGEYGNRYRRMSSGLKNIVFTGSVPHDRVHEFFGLADVFVLTSLSEGLPNVLLEASACGKPAVAPNMGGIPDIVVHGVTGFLADVGNIGSFHHHIRELLEDDGMARTMGRQARRHAVQRFDWDDVVCSYENVYERLLEAGQ